MHISYIEKGEGQTVLFLHGFCESKEIWNHYLEPLSANYRVISADLPGFGQSPLLKNTPTIDHYAEKVEELITELQLKNIIIIGHSFGGYVLLSLVNRIKDNIKGFCLFHSSAFADSEERKVNRNKTIDFVNKNGSSVFAPTLINTLFTPDNLIKLNSKVKELIQIAAHTKEEAIVAASEAMRDRTDKTDVLSNFKGNVLFIIGKEDKAVPLNDSIQQAHLPTNSHVYYMSETAHMGMFEKELECLEVVKSFISFCIVIN